MTSALTEFSVWIQVIASGVFLVLYVVQTEWWKNVTGQVLVGMTTCLFALTLDLAITSTNDGLNSTPAPVFVSRIGFALVMAYGIIRLESK